ncbi:MAG: imidazolonepropionase-like amidohydrolase, partial [Vicingaceae bacterium]
MKRIVTLLFLLIFIPKINAQEYFPNNEGIHSKNNNYTAFINAKIYITPTQIIENAVLLIQNGRVIAVGKTVTIPKNTITIDINGKSIYPSFIDMYSDFGIEKTRKIESARQAQVYDTKNEGHYWNEHIKPEADAYQIFKYDNSKAEELLKAGFGVVNTHIPDGIAQGTGALVALNNEDQGIRLLANQISNHFSFSRSVASNQAYPSSLMGMMALLRQMYCDLDWYKKGNSKTQDLSLEALNKNGNLVQIFASEDKLNSLRASKIAKEFGVNYILKGAGNEYQRIEEIKKTAAKFIIPIDFQEAYDVSNPYQASQLDFSDLLQWNQAPTNLKVLSENGITFALTTDKLKKTEDFRTNLLKAIQYGFDKTKALESLTTIPASLLGKSNEIGSLKEGSFANFLITSGEIFDKETTVYENWVQGSKYVINDRLAKDIRGEYELTLDAKTYKWSVKGEITAPKSEIKVTDAKKLDSKITIA